MEPFVLVGLFAENLLPVFLAAAAGYALAAKLRTEPRSVSHVAFFVLAPCLVFRLIVENRVPAAAVLRMAAFTAVCLVVIAMVAGFVSHRLGWRRSLTSAVVLVVLLPNAGNFGLSANLFAFGDEGLTHATVFFVTSAVLTFTLGVFVASLGGVGLRGSLVGLAKVPALWAVALAFGTLRTGWSLPLPIDRTVTLLSDACIPLFLVILGMQLQRAGLRGPLAPLVLAVAFRLVGGAAIALVLAGIFRLDGAAQQAGVLQASMPTAVICIILATEYDVEPGFVTSAVFASTLLSPLTLTPLLAYLGA